MLAKSSSTPQGRLLGLFDILDDWLNAPNLQTITNLALNNNSQLIIFCTEQAKTLGVENPAMLAQHIVLIAKNAAQQTLAQKASNALNQNHLAHAKKAAHALILAQTQKPSVISTLSQSKTARYSIAASFILVLSVATIWLTLPTKTYTLQSKLAQNDLVTPTAHAHEKGLTAQDATKMYTKYEQMRQGTCQFPEALFIPDKHKAIYLDNVVGGNLPTTLSDLAVTNFYLEQVRCNFTPMLMAASK
ncbi:MAG: hypothetical protein Q8S46_06875 [Methylotenera sp.]|nr:hypothetical protein [Methylotenera sp.]MDP1960495.1 hypothetical protein [Methylotenera sp.]MDP3206310.1 hypothetical protein [Methylotenera sp.]MDP3303861.1 hypothetical protein [Methylotenera sp.]MDP3943782.1 hypothetical protein [Methylotenera sp.]